MNKIIRREKAYFKLSDDSDFFKITQIGDYDVSIICVNSAGIIIYDTRINRIFVEEMFNGIEMVESTEEEFEKVIKQKIGI